LGFITSIGNSYADVLTSLREGKSGVELFPDFAGANIPVKLAGTVKGFEFPSTDREDWKTPPEYKITREQMRSMSPNSVYGFCAMQQAIADAGLTPDLVSHPRTGTTCASSGSMWIMYDLLNTMETKGVQRCFPMSVVGGIAGTLNINLVACYKIKGASMGLISACASSAHAMGAAMDLIKLNRQDIVFVVGAEDITRFTDLPFASVRALSMSTDPEKTPCAFDKKRDGFVATGGSTVLVLEDFEHAQKRGAKIYAEALGWAQTSDGYNVMAPEPNGEGLARCMTLAMEDAGVKPDEIDYINAHATSTPAGDVAELRAVKTTFAGHKVPFISSTKSLTGHGLCLAGAMEAGFSVMSLQEKFMPVSAHVTELDPECAGVPVITQPIPNVPKTVMSNSSGFGGTNVSIVLRALEK
jgi:3-oxoacyl-[acyl-carrier-protein] synthase-1